MLTKVFKALAGATTTSIPESDAAAYAQISNDAFWDWRIADETEYTSPNFWTMIGCPPPDVGRTVNAWQDVALAEDQVLAQRNFDLHIRTRGKHPYEQEVRFKSKSGKITTVLRKGQVVEWDDDGSPLRMMGTHTDISQQKALELQLKNVKQFHDLIKDTNADLVFVKDEEFRIVEANQAFLDLYPPEMQDKIIGYTTLEEYEDDEAELFLEQDKIAFASGMSEVKEKINFPNGGFRILLTRKTRFQDHEGNVFILGVARDITEMETLIEKLESSNRELDNFAYITSHDLKEPLRGIKNHLKSVMRQYADDLQPEVARKIDRSVFLADRMENLIAQLLFYSRLGRADVMQTSVDIYSILKDIKNVTLAANSGGNVTITIADNLPKITCDTTRIRELFRNLITNAIKYNDNEHKMVEIGVDTTAHQDIGIDRDEAVTFFVKDNGIGIPEKFHNDIFRIFKRLHPREAYGGGTGSGLMFVKKIAESHGGKVRIESDPETGSVFYITLPLEHSHDKAE